MDQVRAFGPYAGPWRIAHHAFKFEGMEGLAHSLAGRLLEALPWRFWDGVEGMVPVPLGPDRMRKRGYNPSERLAKVLGEKLSIPLLPLLRKVRSTPPQMSLERAQRWRNPKGAYRAAQGRSFPGRVLLVDDVFTTGATLEECARVLKSAGVKEVKAVVLGRTEHR